MDYVDFIVHIFSRRSAPSTASNACASRQPRISLADLNAEFKATVKATRAKAAAAKASANAAKKAPPAKATPAKKTAKKQARPSKAAQGARQRRSKQPRRSRSL